MSPTSPSHLAVAGMSIEVDGVSVAYRRGSLALDGVSFALRKPGICALVGMNGAGKSTLFKAIMGFVAPTAGRVLICGHPVAWAQRRNIIAYVKQVQDQPNYGGLAGGGLGPVVDGLFTWVIGIGGLVIAAIWIGAHGARVKKR